MQSIAKLAASQRSSPPRRQSLGLTPPPVCVCDHPTLDPTPRPSYGKEYSPVKQVAKASSGLSRARKDARRRRVRDDFFTAAAQASESDAAYVVQAAARLEQMDGRPVRTSAINFENDIDGISSGCAMGSLMVRPDHSASRAALEAWREERRRGYDGFSSSDVLTRHRQLMKRRAGAGVEEGAGEQDEDGDGVVDGVGEGDGVDPSQVAALAAARAKREEAEARVRRLTTSPPARFWWLLLLWAFGGVFGAHRASLRAWRLACMQCGFVLLGVTLIVTCATQLHPQYVPPQRYPFREAAIVSSLASLFGFVAFCLWLRDGYLLFQGTSLRPLLSEGETQLAMRAMRRSSSRRALVESVTASSGGAEAGGDGGGGADGGGESAAGTAAGKAGGAAGSAGAAGGVVGRRSRLMADRLAAQLSPPVSFRTDRALLCLFLTIGLPVCAHRWRLRHRGHAACHCMLTTIAGLLASQATSGTLESAFSGCMTLGCLLLGGCLVLWCRDGIQLLRGRLGPPSAAAVEYWMLLASLGVGSGLGAHRILLGRYRSAALFPLLLCLGGGMAIDAALGLSWATMERTAYTTARSIEGLFAAGILVALLIAIGRDLSSVLRGTLRPKAESRLYWQILYSWLLGGLFVGAHRLAASKVSSTLRRLPPPSAAFHRFPPPPAVFRRLLLPSAIHPKASAPPLSSSLPLSLSPSLLSFSSPLLLFSSPLRLPRL